MTYFSAYATFRARSEPGIVTRHRAYVEALQVTGVETIMGLFESRVRRCAACGTSYTTYEEKETDVAIPLGVVELARASDCDSIVVVSGDTDLLPAIRAAQLIAPQKPLVMGFPYRRFNDELRVAAGRHFKIRPRAYVRHQLADPVIASDGTTVSKPSAW